MKNSNNTPENKEIKGENQNRCSKCGALCGDNEYILEVRQKYEKPGENGPVLKMVLCKACAKNMIQLSPSYQDTELDMEAISKLKDPDHAPAYREYKFVNDIKD